MAKKKSQVQEESAPQGRVPLVETHTRLQLEGDFHDAELVEMACEAYGIDMQYLLGSVVRGNNVTLITAGGSKVTWSPGEEVMPLTDIQITGINPVNERRKPITGGKR